MLLLFVWLLHALIAKKKNSNNKKLQVMRNVSTINQNPQTKIADEQSETRRYPVR